MTSKYELYVPREMREFVATCVEKARDFLEHDGMLTPVAFVGSLGGRCTVIGGLANMPKPVAAKLIANACKRYDAEFMLHVDEGWHANVNTKDEADALREKYGSVENMPGRIDVIMFQLETQVGVFMAMPRREEQLKRGKVIYTFGEPKFDMMQLGQGTFIGLLPRRNVQ